MRVAAAVALTLLLTASAATSVADSPAARGPRAKMSVVGEELCNESEARREVGVEGQSFAFSTLIGCLAPGVSYSNPVIVWGDGATSAGTITHESQGAGEHTVASVTVAGAHTYTQAGSFQITVNLTDGQTGQALEQKDQGVVEVTPSILARVLALSTYRGIFRHEVVAEFVTSLAPAGLSAVIGWGDGTSSAGVISPLAGALRVGGYHRWHRAGRYTLTVKLLAPTGAVLASDVSHLRVRIRPTAKGMHVA